MLQLAFSSTKVKLLKTLFLNSTSFRFFSSQKLIGENLESRGLVKVTGKDAKEFLQGLVTNDVRHLTDGNETSVSLPCIYAMVLNVQGRLLYDVMLYKLREQSPVGECYLLECDSSVIDDMVKHFLRYKLRKKIDLEICHDLTVHSIFHQSGVCDTPKEIENNPCVVFAARDPRLSDLGHRFVLDRGCQLCDIVDDIGTTQEGKGTYRELRHSLGVGEGIVEYPPGECFPLECNAEYLHGVSFTKGCYLGQELTSRIHHTGIVRKRIMPFRFNNKVQYDEIPVNCPIVNETGKSVGKFRSCGPIFGIALLRIDDVLNAKQLTVKDFGEISTHKPKWWPLGT